MSNHKSEDYKLSAVNFYVKNKNKYSMNDVCKIFG